jgi:hypothetical protein
MSEYYEQIFEMLQRARRVDMPRVHPTVTELGENGIIVTRLLQTEQPDAAAQHGEPIITEFGGRNKSKAGSTYVSSPGINKVKEIANFINARRY